MWPTQCTIFLESKLKGREDITEEIILRSGRIKKKKKRLRTSTDNEQAREVLLSIRNILCKSKKSWGKKKKKKTLKIITGYKGKEK